jgi:protein transport protein SEC24
LSCSNHLSDCSVGNSSPKFIRVSTWNVPSTSRLAEDLSIPIVAVIQPFADPDGREEQIPLIQGGVSGPARCEKCGAYVNPWCTWTAGGTRWKCNLCAHETRGELAKRAILSLDLFQQLKVEPDYFSSLDANFARLDYLERPELQKGTVDFDVSQSANYWASNPIQHLGLFTTLPNPTLDDAARRPENIRYVFVLEVSDTSTHSGFLSAACVALRAILYGRFAEDGSEVSPACLPSGSSILLATFDDNLHLHDLSVCTPL